ncbi:MAG: hypothetical protein KA354_25200 [Phycisphaerae bacterium]|nr:hypothetical protein [Phycisphaerae bacterium]
MRRTRRILRAVAAALGCAGAVVQGGVIYVDDNAANDPGPGNPLVSDPLEDGTAGHPFDAIQEGINVATSGDTVLVADGTYAGPGNKDLDFAGRLITVKAANGAATCTIDCAGSGRAFWFHTGETPVAGVDGFTMTGGWGGGRRRNGHLVFCDGDQLRFQRERRTDCRRRSVHLHHTG